MRRNQVEYQWNRGLVAVLIISLLGNILQFSYLVYDKKQQIPSGISNQSVDKQEPIFSEEVYEQKLRTLLDEEELVQLAANAWECIISVNGQEFKGNTQYITSDSMTILLAEILRDESLLPSSIADLGALEQGERVLTDYIHVFSEVPYEVERIEGIRGVKYNLKFENIPDGTMITLQLSELLKSRMHYNDKVTEDRLTIVKRMN